MPDSRLRHRFRTVARPAAMLVLLMAFQEEVLGASPSDKETWRAECGSCHVAFPANALKPNDWTLILAALDRHYGVDASLDARDLAAVAAYLQAQPGPERPGSAATLPRITTSRWFREEHGEVPQSTWQRPGVKGAANCAACHPGAESGRFDEDSIRIPK
ncbi:MAG: cytochrome C [Gammaproteobacteria bacterium]|nr:cytochrome C [Gammaproteobacteria bacterium]